MNPRARGRARSRSRGRGRREPSIFSISSQRIPGGSQYSCFQSHWLSCSILQPPKQNTAFQLLGKLTSSSVLNLWHSDTLRWFIFIYHITFPHFSPGQWISMTFPIIHDKDWYFRNHFSEMNRGGFPCSNLLKQYYTFLLYYFFFSTIF